MVRATTRFEFPKGVLEYRFQWKLFVSEFCGKSRVQSARSKAEENRVVLSGTD